MKKFINPLFGSIILMTIMVSCTNELSYELSDVKSDSQPPIFVNVPDTTCEVSTSRAMDIALQFSTTNNSRSSKTIEAIDIAYGEDGKPALYAINYTGGQGYVVISASKEFYPVLAHSDAGYFKLDDINDSHPASLWISEKKFTIAHASSLPDSIKAQISSQWAMYALQEPYEDANMHSRAVTPAKPQVFLDSLSKWNSDPDITVYLYSDFILTNEYQALSASEKEEISNGIHMYGNFNYGTPESSTLVLIRNTSTHNSYNLLKTTWAQNGDYNSANPYKNSPYNVTSLGCSVVAAGQIMKYHRYPSSYQWNSMPNNYATSTTASFLYSLGTKIGINYKNKKTSATISQVKNALSNEGYEVEVVSHTINKVRSEIQKKLPCLPQRSGKFQKGWACLGMRR